MNEIKISSQASYGHEPYGQAPYGMTKAQYRRRMEDQQQSSDHFASTGLLSGIQKLFR